MKLSKRILLIVGFILITSLVSGVFSIPALYYGYSFFWSFVFFTGAQIAVSYWYDKYIELNILEETKRELLAKPFREYIIALPCQSCGQDNEVKTDLYNSTFRCTRCKRKNGVHTTFMSTVENETVNENSTLDQLGKI